MNVRPLSTVLKCFDLLEVIAEQPRAVRVSELGRLVGQSRATTYQRLVTLAAAGWLERLPDGSYRLSTRACTIQTAALKQAGFGVRAQPILDDLAEEYGEAVSLVVLEQNKLVIAQRAEARGVLRADLKVGAELSYKDSSSGGIWLAFGPDDLARRLAEAGTPMPPKSKIRAVRVKGISIGGGGKTLPGISSIAVPVLDPYGKCIASLSISCPDAGFDAGRFVPSLQKAADRLAAMAAG